MNRQERIARRQSRSLTREAAAPKMWIGIVATAFSRWSKPSALEVRQRLLKEYDEILKLGTCRGTLFIDEAKAKAFKAKETKSSEKTRSIADLIQVESAEYANGGSPDDNKWHYLDQIKNIVLTSGSKARLVKELQSLETEGFGWVHVYARDPDSLIRKLQEVPNARPGEFVEVEGKLYKSKPDLAQYKGMSNALFRVSTPESTNDKVRFLATNEALNQIKATVSAFQKMKDQKDAYESDRRANGVAVLPYRAPASYWLKHSSPNEMSIAVVPGFGNVIGYGSADSFRRIFKDGSFVFHDQTQKPLTEKLRGVACYSLADYAKKEGISPEKVSIAGTLK